MSNKIFVSRITLTYNDKFIESKYKEDRYVFLRKYNIILSVILTSLSILITGLMLKEFPTLSQTLSNSVAFIYCFISLSSCIVLTMLSLCIKNIRCQEWLSYLNYTMVIIVFNNYKFYINFVLYADISIYVLIFFTEMMFRLAWFVFGCIDFIPGVYLQLITIALNFALYSLLLPLNLFFRFSIHNCILIFTSILSYFYIKELKKCFFYNLSLKLKNSWYKSIIDNMNSGFININEKGIKYYNKSLLGFLKNTTNSADNKTEEDSYCSQLSHNIDINELFSNINSDNGLIDSFEQAKEFLKDRYNGLEEERFYFIGTKDVEITSSSLINLEVFGRCNSTDHSLIDRYEFIFNDITRIKLKAQEHAELKYKTLFLSKIAHEFKNPLLYICELVDQLYENMAFNVTLGVDNFTPDLLKQIKSLSSYLIILVKDMDFFSQKNSARNEKRIEIDKVNLLDILNFCKDVVIALIKKSHKELNIHFELLKDRNLPTHIITDEVKLKQVLINLLSNAVKYTITGSIDLKVSVDGDRLKFQVDDTGKGISDSLKDKLFTPFSNEFDKLNKVSSGLGLSIVKELLEMLGSRIEFTSTMSKGSSFWFAHKLGEDELINSFISDRTAIGIHFNEMPVTNKLNSLPRTKQYVIIVDDEAVIRQSTIRLLYKTFKELNYSAEIIEAADGIECLHHYYSLMKEGKRISFILSDETMIYLNGGSTASNLKKIYQGKNLVHVPFYILTAYENLCYDSDCINEVFTKPLKKCNIEQIIKYVRSV
jgi:signal transduction histidine kinase